MPQVTLLVNGNRTRFEVEAARCRGTTREKLGTSPETHIGADTKAMRCMSGECRGMAVKYDTQLVQADEYGVMTIEGVAAQDGTLHPCREMFRGKPCLQCGSVRQAW